MLQERIEELGSAILDYKSNNIVNVIGFMSADRLYDYIERGLDCHFSKGIYKLEPLNLGKIKNDALFIINENGNGNEINRYQFVVLKKDIIKFKDTNKKIRTKTYIKRIYQRKKPETCKTYYPWADISEKQKFILFCSLHFFSLAERGFKPDGILRFTENYATSRRRKSAAFCVNRRFYSAFFALSTLLFIS